ncbi:MAG: phenylalanine--tRNA ligase subunit alpha [Candidatus Moraniibacteriota bacterium]|nr:MAG: phenylalanine--tRNA ligase subunit alpha [Candidatus Moranbacteria bacterium]
MKKTLWDNYAKDADSAKTVIELESVRTKHLGRKSQISEELRKLSQMSTEEKRICGPELQAMRQQITADLDKRIQQKEQDSYDWESQRIDVTLPGEKRILGHLHPITKTLRSIEDIFLSLGFEVAEGPEIEQELYNFDALNIPKDHPARDMQDAFWMKEKDEKGNALLPRTQTSAVQVRYMEKHTPPFRIIVPGKIFRNEATDASHEHTFHQFEALVVGDNIHVSHFKAIAQDFFSTFFEKDITLRLRPSYFPFTEPSFEFDISCTVCKGSGCSVCKKSGWIEVGGAGMVHQNVFVSAGYERGRYTGFAWGFGVERLAMMKYKIDDIRLFHSGDLRFIRQF